MSWFVGKLSSKHQIPVTRNIKYRGDSLTNKPSKQMLSVLQYKLQLQLNWAGLCYLSHVGPVRSK